MSVPRPSRLGGGAGILFIAILVAAAVLTGDQPGSGASQREVVSYLSDSGNRDKAMVATFLVPLAGFAFLWFAFHLRELVRAGDREDGRLTAVVMPAAIGFAALVGAIFALGGALAEAIEYFDNARPDATLWFVLQGLSYQAMVWAALPGAALVAAVSVSARRSGALPRWLAAAGLVIAALEVPGIAAGGYALIGVIAWILVVSVVLVARTRAGVYASSRTATATP
jgi:hypothetical protein